MKTQLLIKTDKKLKEEAKKVAEEMGLPLNIIMNNYLKDLIKNRRIEFQAPLIPNKKTAKLLNQVEQDIKIKKNLAGPFATADDFIKELNK